MRTHEPLPPTLRSGNNALRCDRRRLPRQSDGPHGTVLGDEERWKEARQEREFVVAMREQRGRCRLWNQGSNLCRRLAERRQIMAEKEVAA